MASIAVGYGTGLGLQPKVAARVPRSEKTQSFYQISYFPACGFVRLPARKLKYFRNSLYARIGMGFYPAIESGIPLF